MTYDGVIMKGIGGFYYVETADGVFECKAKGRFRKEKITPLAGDKVKITVSEAAENTVDEILERKNFLLRPPVANIDILLIVVSTCEPKPNTLLIDKMTVIAEKNNIEPVIVFTKSDLSPCDEYVGIYKKTGYKTFAVSPDKEDELYEIKEYLSGKLTAFTGNSGVGKSTLINRLCPELELQTSKISVKLGRGRHTTRQAEIFHVGEALIIDTAGFSSVDFIGSNVILKEDLQFYFKEFSTHIGECKFTGCAHINNKGCSICELVEKGEISRSRYESYMSLYEDAKNIKDWQL